MSLILEALKKSEARRRLGAAPTLGTPITTPARRRHLLPYFVIVLAIFAGAIAWLLHLHQAPSSPTPNVPAARHASAQAAATHATRAVSGPADRRPVQSAANPASPRRVAAASARRDESKTRSPRVAPSLSRLPMWQAAKRKSDARRANIARTAAAVPATQPHAAPKPPRAMPQAKPAAHAQPSRMVASTGNRHTAPPPQPAPEHDKPAVKTVPAAATATIAGNGAPPYYKLPYAVRKALPALKLSMHVYAHDPESRFVILNDTRMIEGDKTSDDLTLEKIVPGGVILEFQGHQFFYPRDGF